jgi:hypothetical protein
VGKHLEAGGRRLARAGVTRLTWALAALCLLLAAPVRAEEPWVAPPPIWEAKWVTHPAAAPHGPAVLRFRTEATFETVPKSAPVLVSADNRFALYVNGQRVGAGPSRGDLAHWRYQRLDLAPFLKPGRNVVAASVWNFGQFSSVAQVSARTGFILQAQDRAFRMLDTGQGGWRVLLDEGHAPVESLRSMFAVIPEGYYAAGPRETIDGARTSFDWREPGEPRGRWVAPSPVLDVPAHAQGPWRLIADPLPPMRYRKTGLGRVARTDLPSARRFPQAPFTVPANSRARVLLDRGEMVAAYPKLTVTGGAGAKIKATYAEGLYDQAGRKGDRSAVAGRRALGVVDQFVSGGGRQVFEPLWWRVWRYLELEIETGAQPLRVEALEAFETGYPFEVKGSFVSSDPVLNRIWQAGWRTAEIDAHETYMDSAYWEQLQYLGDTRIQALISYAVAGDARLAEQAMEAFSASRTPAGLTQSRWPANEYQSIPPFSLLFIGMLHDAWMETPDRAVVARQLPTARSVLARYAEFEDASGLSKSMPGWNFVDWVEQPQSTYPSYDAQGRSCLVSLLRLGALDEAADLEAALGDPGLSRRHRADAARVRGAIRSLCWDPQRGLFADAPGSAVFSQQANTLAVLYGAAPQGSEARIMAAILPGEGLAPPPGMIGASYYFSFYVARALERAGLADRYLGMLAPWRGMMALNFTTLPETKEPTRSDTHAWSAHPTADLIGVVAGIRPAAPGFARVRVEPHLGSLTSVEASRPHREGLIRVRYRQAAGRLAAEVELPGALEGEFVWKGQRRPLSPGLTRLELAG